MFVKKTFFLKKDIFKNIQTEPYEMSLCEVVTAVSISKWASENFLSVS